MADAASFADDRKETGGRESPGPQRAGRSEVIDSTYLLADRAEVQIRHAGQLYRLRVTRNGKLILNK